MELVTLDGYTEVEKVAIARDHLWPRQLERAGITADEVTITDEALGQIAAEYTREAGVRQLERALARILRKAAVTLATTPPPAVAPGPTTPPTAFAPHPATPPPAAAPRPITTDPLRVGIGELAGYLGRPRFTPESAERTAAPGVATGLAVTGAGGDVLFIEATSMPGEPGLTLTGQLGDVMKESAQIALSYLRAHGPQLGVDPEALSGRRIHLHVPAGAVPKDGPSAGITMVTALASLASGRPVRPEVGMTGEVTLAGRVLPIGGVKQKLLAAHRAGLTEVIIPARNGPDLDDLPAEIRKELTIHPLTDVSDVLALVLRPTSEPTAELVPAA
jgi:ATP-dependent Lon protease